MENNKWLKSVSIAIGILLVVSLIMNNSMAKKITLLENRIDEIIGLQYSISSNLDNQTNHITNVLQEIWEQNTWLGHVEMVDIKSTDQGEEAIIEWQVRELGLDSEVYFHYVLGNGDNFSTVHAELKQDGLFQVAIPFELEVEPNWMVSLYADEENSTTNVQEEGSKHSTALRYYISMKDPDGNVKSGDIEILDINDLGTEKYGHIEASVHLYNEKIDVTLSHFYELNNEIVHASLLQYENNQLLEEIDMKLDHVDESMNMKMFHLFGLEEYDDMRLVMQVEYKDGSTYQKEIY